MPPNVVLDVIPESILLGSESEIRHSGLIQESDIQNTGIILSYLALASLPTSRYRVTHIGDKRHLGGIRRKLVFGARGPGGCK